MPLASFLLEPDEMSYVVLNIRILEKLTTKNPLLLDFQKELLNLSKKGILLAINSNNNFEDSIERFERFILVASPEILAALK